MRLTKSDDMLIVVNHTVAHHFIQMQKILTIILFGVLFFSTHFVSAGEIKNLSRQDLMKQFADNPELKLHDLDLFPLEMKRFLVRGHLDWEKDRITGFSKRISGRHVLFSTDREGLGGHSKAVIYSRQGQWQPLMLPQLGRDNTIRFSSSSSRLRWDTDSNVLYSNHCTHVGLSEVRYLCARYFYELHWAQSSLTWIDGLAKTTGFKRTPSGKWTWRKIWENGKWLEAQ